MGHASKLLAPVDFEERGDRVITVLALEASADVLDTAEWEQLKKEFESPLGWNIIGVLDYVVLDFSNLRSDCDGGMILGGVLLSFKKRLERANPLVQIAVVLPAEMRERMHTFRIDRVIQFAPDVESACDYLAGVESKVKRQPEAAENVSLKAPLPTNGSDAPMHAVHV